MSKEYSAIGTVKEVQGVQEVGNNGTQKNTVVLNVVDGQYENDLAIDFFKERATKVDELSPGQEVEIHFNIRSNQGSGDRYFTNLTGWKWNVTRSAASSNDLEF